MIDVTKYELSPDKLRWECSPSVFDFKCTRDIAPLREFIGQDRAIRAVEFGLSMDHDGYNIYVAGIAGTGKTSIVKTYIQRLIEKQQAGDGLPPPEDWCYLYNFSDTDRPQTLNLPRGKGKVFRDQLNNLQQQLSEGLIKAFSSEEYVNLRKKTIEESQAEQQKLFENIGEEAQRQGFTLQMTPIGPALIPVVEGKPLSQAEYLALDKDVRHKLETRRTELLKKLQEAIEKARDLERQTAEKIQNADKEVADFTISRLFERLAREYENVPQVTKFLADLKTFTLDNLEIFRQKPEQMPQIPGLALPASYLMAGRDPYLPFRVNVFVDNSETQGPPVIEEQNPTYGNLFGKIERRFVFGGYLSDHTMLKAGSLQRANNGFLLLSTSEVLTKPAVWPTLKRAIKTREARIEDPFEQFGLIAPQGMRPQPMPANVKVVLIGDAFLYHVLAMYDEDFWEIFRVKADFDYQIDRTPENLKGFAGFIAGCCDECKLRPFDRTGVAQTVEYAARMVADQEKLSTRFAVLKELVEESEYWARKEGAAMVSANHVERAVEERYYRHNLPEEHIREMIQKNMIMIDVDGEVAGQVNGLSVYMLGDITFGKPSRITCKTYLGRSGVINIERESNLSGHIHDKGVLILSGYMGWKYAQDRPLSLSASLAFEQSYEGVDGDSASSAELYSLLSSLSGVPLRQDIAVTGSVNQKGEIQPIGGVNHKIEGFFRVCKAKGLTGKQGVMIPHQNVRNLMLRPEVVDAVREGKFHIYAVSKIDEGIEVLTGMTAGEKKADGAYPKGTVNYLVDKQLKDMAQKLKQFTALEEKKVDGKVESHHM